MNFRNLTTKKDSRTEFQKFTEKRIERYNILKQKLFNGQSPPMEESLKQSYIFEKDYEQMRSKVEILLDEHLGYAEWDQLFILIMGVLAGPIPTRLKTFYKMLELNPNNSHLKFTIEREIKPIQNEIDRGLKIIQDMKKTMELEYETTN